MDIAIIGTGFIGTTLGGALAEAGHNVTFGSRHPEEGAVAGTTVAAIAEALANAEVVILALPGDCGAGTCRGTPGLPRRQTRHRRHEQDG